MWIASICKPRDDDEQGLRYETVEAADLTKLEQLLEDYLSAGWEVYDVESPDGENFQSIEEAHAR